MYVCMYIWLKISQWVRVFVSYEYIKLCPFNINPWSIYHKYYIYIFTTAIASVVVVLPLWYTHDSIAMAYKSYPPNIIWVMPHLSYSANQSATRPSFLWVGGGQGLPYIGTHLTLPERGAVGTCKCRQRRIISKSCLK